LLTNLAFGGRYGCKLAWPLHVSYTFSFAMAEIIEKEMEI